MRWGWLALMLVCSCGSGPRPLPPEPVANNVRQTPLTPEEVREMISARGANLAVCYSRERLNSQTLAKFVFEVQIPNDGRPHGVEMVDASVEGQEILAECLTRVLSSIKFPAHVGSTFKVQVPIEPSGGL